jgi:NAD(P)-dependent dehydrogenase (short-subunit alcohol dehydrogenase family)
MNTMTDQRKYADKLANQHILIIGGTSGLGYGLAEALLEHSAHVYVSSSNPSRVQDAVSKLRNAYPCKSNNMHGFACNLGDESNLEANVQKLFQEVSKVVPGGMLDHVVHTAGDPLAMMAIDDWDFGKIKKAGRCSMYHFQECQLICLGLVRFYAPLFIAKAMRPYLKPGPHSSFTITTGVVSQKPIPNWTVVAAYAGGLHAMTRNLAVDLKPIRVNLISPGVVDTELWNAIGDRKEEVLAEMGKSTLTGKLGQVQDVVEAYLYVLKDENSTGSCVSTNSGGIMV